MELLLNNTDELSNSKNIKINYPKIPLRYVS